MATATLVIMRHGESAWTDKRVNKFAGWVDDAYGPRARPGGGGRQACARRTSCPTPCSRRFGALHRERGHRPGRGGRLRSLQDPQLAPQRAPLRRVPGPDAPRHARALRRRALQHVPPQLWRAPARDRARLPYFQGDDPRYGTPPQDGSTGTDPRAIRSECLKDVIARLEPFWGAYVTPLAAPAWADRARGHPAVACGCARS